MCEDVNRGQLLELLEKEGFTELYSSEVDKFETSISNGLDSNEVEFFIQWVQIDKNSKVTDETGKEEVTAKFVSSVVGARKEDEKNNATGADDDDDDKLKFTTKELRQAIYLLENFY